ncbi:MAG TPA: acetate--CoA ligase [Candidatus Nanoarchaeia archaeon]|nr:acetate--CoA ligase [Candidatus Nanoarchaeia archaeon]
MSEFIDSILKEKRVFYPHEEYSRKSHIKSMKEYSALYKKSIENPTKFWAERAGKLEWFKKWDTVLRDDMGFFKWFEGGQLNVSYNCLDRIIKQGKGKKIAYIWEPESGETKTYTYEELLKEVCRFSNVLKKKGVKRGDVVQIYLPMVPELPVAMLACARIGAIHSIVFAGFSSDALKDRIQDSNSVLLVTADGSFRAGKIVPLKENADIALKDCPSIKNVIVVKRTSNNISLVSNRDFWWDDLINEKDIADFCEPAHMNSEESLFILYTSGTTGKPKGILHTQAGYLLFVNQTFKYIFDIRDSDIYFCTADIGWITGHSYIVYGPLSDGATTVMYEGSPTFPQPDRFWKIIEKHKVSIFYTAPTAIRALAKEGDEWPNKCSLHSLRLLGTVGEPINPEAWMWYHNIIGKKKCPIVDTWWQTETGGILITPLPGATPLKPGSATKPFFGIVAEVLREDGSKAHVNEGGYLVIKHPWPGMLRTVWNNPDRYKKTYFEKFGMYLTGDTAHIDEDGYFWIMGRSDDVIKVAGHRIGSAEVESSLVSHHAVAEAAIAPYPHEIKGQAIYAFVVLKKGFEKGDKLKEELRNHVSKTIGPIAKPEKIQFADDLPKTRSGKIMRRILKVIAEGGTDYGNVTTLVDPNVVKILAENRVK